MSGLAEEKVKNQTGKFGEGYFELIALSGGAGGGGGGDGGGGGVEKNVRVMTSRSRELSLKRR